MYDSKNSKYICSNDVDKRFTLYLIRGEEQPYMTFIYNLKKPALSWKRKFHHQMASFIKFMGRECKKPR